MNMRVSFKLVIMLLLLVCMGLNVQSDDKELFMGINIEDNIVRPNVVTLMDSSGSMNTIIFYPKEFGPDGIEDTDDDDEGFDSTRTYSGYVEGFTSDTNSLSSTAWYARWVYNGNGYELEKSELEGFSSKNFWTGCYSGDGTPNNFRVGSNSNFFRVGDKVMYRDKLAPYTPAVATLKRKYTGSDGQPWFELEDIEGGPIVPNASSDSCHFQQSPDGKNWKPVIIHMYGINDAGYPARWPRDYVEWVFIHATEAQQKAVTHFTTWGTFDVDKKPAPELSECATPGNDDLESPNPRIKKLFTRIQVAREVVCKVATDSNQIVKLGLFKFNYNNGATLEEGLSDMSDESSELVAYKNNVWDIAGDAWTPLSEALADVWYYYKPGPASKTYWPVDYEITKNLVNHSDTNPVTPVEYWCQNNYIVLMTDGESTMDRFDDWTKYGNSIFKQKPVKRTEPWEDWDDGWGDTDNNEKNSGVPYPYSPTGTYCPNYTCWYIDNGSDYLDDVAYFIRHQDMFPDFFFGTDPVTGWPGQQNIFTYTIGFTTDNDMLLQTAINGDGAYYTANNYEQLVEAFQQIITSINLRNYAFSSITAPKKATTATNDELTMSYVGYFLPSQASAIWEGHLLAFKLEDLWGYDEDESGVVEEQEFVYDSEKECVTASDGVPCDRWIYLNIGQEWDAAAKMSSSRALYTNDTDPDKVSDLVEFDSSKVTTLQTLIGGVTEEETEMIVAKLNQPHLADVFHSDVSFIGPPSPGKQYLPNIEPPGEDDQQYLDFYDTQKSRTRVLYVGTNDGIMHMFYADGSNGGKEIWGYIPDAVLPSLKNIVIDSEHTYTVDGRITAEDVWFEKEAGVNTWSTILTFGLRRGGNYYYALDITEVGTQPKVLWKFKDDKWSGLSFGKPIVGKVLIDDPDSPGTSIPKWVVFITGGFAFNSEYSDDQKGKAIFMLDAADGKLLWMLGYDADAEEVGEPGEGYLSVGVASDNLRLLTKDEKFNYSIPSSLTAVDIDNNGYVDTLYFGNVGGFLFKTDISASLPLEWQTAVLFQTEIKDIASATITNINFTELTVDNKTFLPGYSITGKTSHATGYVRTVDNKVLTVEVTSGTFVVDEVVVCRSYDPIYLSPAIFYDRCSQVWLGFGTGDRDRPRTSPIKGSWVMFKDNGTLQHEIGDTMTLQDFSDAMKSSTPGDQELTNLNGFFFDFPDDAEKMFDPEPVVLPDNDFNPNVYFNTYQPPPPSIKTVDNPCEAPGEGSMTLYHLRLLCGEQMTLEGGSQSGRIAGGGVYGGKEYVMYEGTDGNVASSPGSDENGDSNIGTKLTKLDYAGGVVFWLERRR